MTRYYCTYFDRNYLVRGLALIDSLRVSESKDWVIFVVCMDEMTHLVLRRLGLANVQPIPLHDIESRDRPLLGVKPTRSLVEYYWTLTPTVILRIMERHRQVDVLTYLDADLFFFSSPQPLFDELGQTSILIHEHRFSPRQKDLATHNGRFNVGLLMFRRDENGLNALRWWRARCIEWCFTRYEQGKMGDQLYLNDWPQRFRGVTILRHVGGGVGPWNHDRYVIASSDNGSTLVDGQSLIFYHFHSFKLVAADAAIPVSHAHYPLTYGSLRHCFVPYAEALAAGHHTLHTAVPDVRWGMEESLTIAPQLTFIAHSQLRETLSEHARGHRMLSLTPRWDAYCSEQVLDQGSAGRHATVSVEHDISHQNHQIIASASEVSMPTPTQHDSFMSLYQTETAKQIRSLYVIGAHRFQERDLFDRLFPNLERIYLFEPIPQLAEYLRRFEKVDSRVKVFCCALSNENATRDFFLTNNDGESSSLLHLGKHKQIFPHVHEIRSIPVSCRTLESIIQEHGLSQPDMLLLDVQGAEFQILSSLSPDLKARVLALYVEASLEEVYAGAKCLDDLKEVLQADHDLVSFAPLGPDSPTHGNALFVNRRFRADMARPKRAGGSEHPLISVIVSSYCAEAFMRECLSDLERQTVMGKMEIIVVDAASPEQEGSIVREFQQRHQNIIYLRMPSRIGVYAAWNVAIKLAKGRFITPFSTNDRLRSDAYEILAKTLEERPDVALVYGDTSITAQPHQSFERHDRCDLWQWPDYRYEGLLTHCGVGPHPMWRSEVHRAVGYFDETYVALGDQDFWIRLGAQHQLLHIPVVTGLYWRSPEGLSNRKEIAEPEEKRLRATYPPSIRPSTPSSRQPVRETDRTYDCSVIIPVWNRCELTRECVAALATTTKDVSWELIVVDNHSTDDTPAFLSGLSGDVQVIRNQENLGFARACNQGAQAARGRHLIFLNNDTVPLDGWLSAMLREVETHREVGVVGSKLLYADGTIQHAGVIFLREQLSPYHIYRLAPADHPAVNQRREFQAVTAACLLIRRNLFEQVGGFDERFRNGFEDVDLCLKVKAAGSVIVYQPQSVLYHLESQTPGRKQFEEENGRLLTERWGGQWWSADEDLYYHSDGYKLIWDEAGGSTKGSLELLIDNRDRDQWAHVARTQRAALVKDWDAVRKELICAADWPSDCSVLLWGARTCDRLQEPELLEIFVRRCLQIRDSSAARCLLIRTLIDQREFEGAEEHLNTELTIRPLLAEAWLYKGVLSMQHEAYQEAETAFASAMQHGGDRQKSLLGSAMAAFGTRRFEQAWDRFALILAEWPDHPEAMHWLLRTGTALQRWEDLADHFDRYVMRNPGDLTTRFAFAGVLLRADRLDRARLEYDTLRVLDPSYDGLAELARALAEGEAALEAVDSSKS
ncbi:hypothetical protein W02_19170 [Nitrospira sp. KM1]|uniref:FkbM family methyltransferase n=1 Tax=Nitrospira sp. KM1 TaxID=1936990 RepID=UPI0013A75147|nr:FkbM family methyltransferase [Nitrospira sp. KM1]BCA54777.1 hypothetical protein W02_19170 [Nitrospira sp. KM1]